ncbi:DUF6445 family protein [Sphingomonas bacterium]|uniref:DUF6445 family protein n=1 Tax=Sphingomonas bacterium TaxID=1895847 RepID=UPI00261D7988|nr:DUF6445 family protein [Sphingomonas bacterium]MDB5679312.1 hypothetical protein [Sphingomonas bacterium]
MKIDIQPIGHEREPVVVIEDFATDPDALRAFAMTRAFGPAAHHYPGIRAALPDDYLPTQLCGIAQVLADAFGAAGPVDVIDASYSIVTTRPENLSVGQRLPHCDAHARGRIALIHYLSSESGTAFFRHRSTGFETVDECRAAIYTDQLAAELRHVGPPPAAFIAGDTPLFERVMVAEARYNRALLYRSCLLHSGAIQHDAMLSPDPAVGRLTITGFLSVGE